MLTKPAGPTRYSDIEIALVQKLSDEGHTAAETAAIFSETFGRMVTRSSIIGLWHRPNINRDTATKRVVIKAAPPVKFNFADRKTKRTKLPDPIAKAKAERAKIAREIRMQDSWQPLPGCEPVSLVDRGPNDCKWPLDIWDDYSIRKSCGATVEYDGANFCPAHSAIAYRPPVSR